MPPSPVITLIDTDITQQTNFGNGAEFVVRTWEIPDMDVFAAYPLLEFRIHFVADVELGNPVRVRFRWNGTRYGVNGSLFYDQDLSGGPDGVPTHWTRAAGAQTLANPGTNVNFIKLCMIAQDNNIINNVTITIRGVA